MARVLLRRADPLLRRLLRSPPHVASASPLSSSSAPVRSLPLLPEPSSSNLPFSCPNPLEGVGYRTQPWRVEQIKRNGALLVLDFIVARRFVGIYVEVPCTVLQYAICWFDADGSSEPNAAPCFCNCKIIDDSSAHCFAYGVPKFSVHLCSWLEFW